MILVTGHVSIVSHDAQLDFARAPADVRERWIAESRARVESSGSNLIVNSGLDAIAAKMGHVLNGPSVGGESPANVNDLQVAEMQLGDDPTPTAPAASDTALASDPILTTISSLVVSYPATGAVAFAGTIAPNTQNGKTLTEVGLFFDIDDAKVLLGRRVADPVVTVAPLQAYTVIYRINFAAS
tara:strand:+ start:1192 stop:1743 length:552 start_codon:yes stop_codon:yes gene_type:complete